MSDVDTGNETLENREAGDDSLSSIFGRIACIAEEYGHGDDDGNGFATMYDERLKGKVVDFDQTSKYCSRNREQEYEVYTGLDCEDPLQEDKDYRYDRPVNPHAYAEAANLDKAFRNIQVMVLHDDESSARDVEEEPLSAAAM